MKVMLVTPITQVRPDLHHVPRPEVGDTDIVIAELQDKNGDTYYCLERFGTYYLYVAKLFAILPDQELVTEQKAL